ncbi:hypothetical protein GGI12_002953 [Dipsacomyces acuminosporus]|nr:hypothetical protein GGI12_002953 [Dipsacomyces acuminosporus]
MQLNYALGALAICAGSAFSVSALKCSTEPSSPGKPGREQASLIVFGDSMSDNGSTPHYSNYSHYWGDRYSNSYMWNEYAAKLLDLKLENWAIGGSTTDNKFAPVWGKHGLIPSVADVVPQYIANNTNASDFKKKNSIIAIDGGGNDFFYKLDDLRSGKLDLVRFLTKMVGNQINTIKLLLNAGYRKIYLLNMPSLTIIPAMAEYGAVDLVPKVERILNRVFSAHMAALYRSVGEKAREVRLFDLQSLMETSAQKESLKALNITEVQDFCITTNPDGSFNYCANPDVRYFYDDFHPSGRPHYLIGVVFAKTVKNPRFAVTVKSIRQIAKHYDIAHSDNAHNIIANGSRK